MQGETSTWMKSHAPAMVPYTTVPFFNSIWTFSFDNFIKNLHYFCWRQSDHLKAFRFHRHEATKHIPHEFHHVEAWWFFTRGFLCITHQLLVFYDWKGPQYTLIYTNERGTPYLKHLISIIGYFKMRICSTRGRDWRRCRCRLSKPSCLKPNNVKGHVGSANFTGDLHHQEQFFSYFCRTKYFIDAMYARVILFFAVLAMLAVQTFAGLCRTGFGSMCRFWYLSININTSN